MSIDPAKKHYCDKRLKELGLGRGNKINPPRSPKKIIDPDKFIGPKIPLDWIVQQAWKDQMFSYSPERSLFVERKLQERFGSKVVNFRRLKNE